MPSNHRPILGIADMTPDAEEKLLLKTFAAVDPSKRSEAIRLLQVLAQNYPFTKRLPAVKLHVVGSVRG